MSLVRAVALAVLCLSAAGPQPARAGGPDAPSGTRQLAMTVSVPRAAHIAAVPAHSGEANDLCGPGSELRPRPDGGWTCATGRAARAELATYQTFEVASLRPEGGRVAVRCLGREDRVVEGACVQRVGTGFARRDGTPVRSAEGDAIECTIPAGAPVTASAAVGVAVCLDVPPLR